MYWTSGYPSFPCGDYLDGVSGAPFLVNGQIRGVIGGLHQGGCLPTISYSSSFSSYGGVGVRLLQRVEAGGAANWLPRAGSDGC